MRFDSFVIMLGEQPYFDLATVVQLSGEQRAKTRTQLYRWIKAGKVVSLRRGVYALADVYRHGSMHPACLANVLYRPSYLSGLWALGFYGLIPEKVVIYTSVTSRVPRRFENTFGVFDYRHVKRGAFFGYRISEIQQDKVLMADPEKALLDLWYLSEGEWTVARMAEMRFQHRDAVDASKLRTYAAVFDSPRLMRAVDVWCGMANEEEEGSVEL